MSARSLRVFGPGTYTSGSGTVLYTVPADKRLLLKEWSFANLAATHLDGGLYLKRGEQYDLFAGFGLPPYQSRTDSDRYMVLNPGEQLFAYGSNGTGGTWSMYGGGVLLQI